MSWWLWTVVGMVSGVTLESIAILWIAASLKAKVMSPLRDASASTVGGIPMRR